MKNFTNRFLNKEQSPVVNLYCQYFEVNNWLISEFILKKIVPLVGIHPYPLNELMLMVAAICRVRPTHIFEWGTHYGKSARIFYETARFFKIKSEIHSIDLSDSAKHQEHPGSQRGELVKNIKSIKLYQGDGLTVALKLCRQLKPTTSLFFLDGDHQYRSIKKELNGIIKTVPQAHILVHDTFNQSKRSGYNPGPYRAVKAFLTQVPRHRYQVIEVGTGLPGMTFLYHQKI